MQEKNKLFARQLREADVAEILNVSREKLRSDRRNGTGAPYRRYGRSIRYDEHELVEYMRRAGRQ